MLKNTDIFSKAFSLSFSSIISLISISCSASDLEGNLYGAYEGGDDFVPVVIPCTAVVPTSWIFDTPGNSFTAYDYRPTVIAHEPSIDDNVSILEDSDESNIAHESSVDSNVSMLEDSDESDEEHDDSFHYDPRLKKCEIEKIEKKLANKKKSNMLNKKSRQDAFRRREQKKLLDLKDKDHPFYMQVQEQKKKKSERVKGYYQKRLANMTEEERCEMRKRESERRRKWYANMSEEKRERYLKKARDRIHAQKREKTSSVKKRPYSEIVSDDEQQEEFQKRLNRHNDEMNKTRKASKGLGA